MSRLKGEAKILHEWGLKSTKDNSEKDSNLLASIINELDDSWHCSHCTYKNGGAWEDRGSDACGICREYSVHRAYLRHRAERLCTASIAHTNYMCEDLMGDLEDFADLTNPIENSTLNTDFDRSAPLYSHNAINKSLPSEALTFCLSYLDTVSEIVRIGLVCKGFYLLICQDVLWSPFFAVESTLIRSLVNTCSDCGLIHRNSCHFNKCSSCPEPVVANDGSSAHIVVKSKEQLAKLWTEGRRRSIDLEGMREVPEETVDTEHHPRRILTSEFSRPSSHEAQSSASRWDWNIGMPFALISECISKRSSTSTLNSSECRRGDEGQRWTIDGKYFHRYRIHVGRNKDMRKWEALSCGWEWLQQHIRERLRKIWNQNFLNMSTTTEDEVTTSSLKVSPFTVTSGHDKGTSSHDGSKSRHNGSTNSCVSTSKRKALDDECPGIRSCMGSALKRPKLVENTQSNACDNYGHQLNRYFVGKVNDDRVSKADPVSEMAKATPDCKRSNGDFLQQGPRLSKSGQSTLCWATRVAEEARVVHAEAQVSLTFQRALKKLVSRDWFMCYDSFRREIILQAQGLCEDLKRMGKDLLGGGDLSKYASALSARNCGDTGDRCGDDGHSDDPHISRAHPHEPDAMRQSCEPRAKICMGVARACAAFLSWCEELDETCWALTDKIGSDVSRAGSSWDDSTGNMSAQRHPRRSSEIVSMGLRFDPDLEGSHGDGLVSQTDRYGEPHIPSLLELGLHALRGHTLLAPGVAEMIEDCIEFLGEDIDENGNCLVGVSPSSLDASQLKHPPSVDNLPQRYSTEALLDLLALVERINVADNSVASMRKTKEVLRSRFWNPLLSIGNLAPHVRFRMESAKELMKEKTSCSFHVSLDRNKSQ